MNKAMRLILVGVCVLMLVACSSDGPSPTQAPTIGTATPRPLPQSDWGTVERLAIAEQLDGVAFSYTVTDRMATWVGTNDEQRAQHFAQGLNDSRFSLDMPTFYAQQQTLTTTTQGALKLWLDRNNSEQELRLQAATIGFDGQLMAGIIPVNARRTRHYSLLQIAPREFRIVTSEGLGEITNLYLHQIDDAGRPARGGRLQIDGDHPAMIQDSAGRVHLFWLNDNGRHAYHARFDDRGVPELVDVRRIASVDLDVTDFIRAFRVGYDGTTAYLLWTIRTIDDAQQVFMSSGQLTDENFAPPVQLFDADERPYLWASPAGQVQSPLPIVANIGDELRIMWLAEGQMIETDAVVRSGRLIGMPQIVTDETRIGISWAQPASTGAADLYLIERSREN